MCFKILFSNLLFIFEATTLSKSGTSGLQHEAAPIPSCTSSILKSRYYIFSLILWAGDATKGKESASLHCNHSRICIPLMLLTMFIVIFPLTTLRIIIYILRILIIPNEEYLSTNADYVVSRNPECSFSPSIHFSVEYLL